MTLFHSNISDEISIPQTSWPHKESWELDSATVILLLKRNQFGLKCVLQPLIPMKCPYKKVWHESKNQNLWQQCIVILKIKVKHATNYRNILKQWSWWHCWLCNCNLNISTHGQSIWDTNCTYTALTLILRRSRTGTVWFYTSTSNKRAARPKVYTKSLIRDLKLMYSRLTLVRLSINL